MKSGFISVLGRANVGKSSIINALIGEKVSIVSPKPQTTQDKIMGVLTENGYQMVFIDTPGIFKPKTKLDEFMSKRVRNSVIDADIILYVIDALKPIFDSDIELIKGFAKKTPTIILINKTDLTNYEKIYPKLEQLSPLLEENIREIVPCSAKTKFNLDKIKGFLLPFLTDENQYFDVEDLSDKPLTFLTTEIIREKALYLLDDEIPHGIGVMLSLFKEEEKIVNIEADIVAERDSHKQIIIGKDGSMLKEIGTRARIELESLLNKKVFLKLFVKVREDWRNRKNIMADIGFKD